MMARRLATDIGAKAATDAVESSWTVVRDWLLQKDCVLKIDPAIELTTASL